MPPKKSRTAAATAASAASRSASQSPTQGLPPTGEGANEAATAAATVAAAAVALAGAPQVAEEKGASTLHAAPGTKDKVKALVAMVEEKRSGENGGDGGAATGLGAMPEVGAAKPLRNEVDKERRNAYGTPSQ